MGREGHSSYRVSGYWGCCFDIHPRGSPGDLDGGGPGGGRASAMVGSRESIDKPQYIYICLYTSTNMIGERRKEAYIGKVAS